MSQIVTPNWQVALEVLEWYLWVQQTSSALHRTYIQKKWKADRPKRCREYEKRSRDKNSASAARSRDAGLPSETPS